MHLQRRFALDLQFYPYTTLSPHTKPVSTCVNTGLTCMLCGASSGPHLPAAARTRGYTLAVPARTRYLRLREALDAVLGDACKEQRLQLGSVLAKD